MLAGKKRIRDDSQESSDGYNTENEMIKELGYGKSLFKDEQDEREIINMKEIDRERILDDRHQRMKSIKEKIKLLREYKKENRDQAAPADTRTGALSDLRHRREKRLQQNASGSESGRSKSDDESSAGIDKDSEASYSSGERSDDDMDDDQLDKPKGINWVDLERVRVSRSDLEKWSSELFFEDTIRGAFVRVNLGETEKGTIKYKIAEILRLKNATHTYTFGNRKVDKELVVRHGDSERAFKMIVISNAKFTASEFSEWIKYCKKKGVPIPNIDRIEEIESRLKKTRNYSYSPNEINKIIEQNINQLIEKGSSSMNITYIKTQLETQYKMAKSVLEANPESDEAKEIYNKMKNNLDKLNEIQKKKNESHNQKNAAQNFNQRTHKLQIEEDMKRSVMIKRKLKQTDTFDPFSTLACKPKILWNTNNETEKTPATNKSNKDETTFKSAAEPGDQLIKKPKAEYKTDFEKALARKDRILETIKTIDLGIDHLISVDPNDFSKYPPLNKIPKLAEMHPVLKAKLEAKHKQDVEKDTRKVLSLQEYIQMQN